METRPAFLEADVTHNNIADTVACSARVRLSSNTPRHPCWLLRKRLVESINRQADKVKSLQATVDIDASLAAVKKGK